MKRRYIYFFTFLVLAFLFRGPLFSLLFEYSINGERDIYLTKNEQLTAHSFEFHSSEKMLKNSLMFTANHLDFSSEVVDPDPNISIKEGKANCIGYAAMFANIYSQNSPRNHEVKHCVGKISLLGIDLHSKIDHPFFKDHDFNLIIDTETGDSTLVDPTLYEYFGIVRL